MNKKSISIVLLTTLMLPFNLLADNHGKNKSRMSDNVKVAENWVTASYTSKERLIRIVKNHMADDGVNYPGRFIDSC